MDWYTNTQVDIGGARALPPSMLRPNLSGPTGAGLTESATGDRTGLQFPSPVLSGGIRGFPGTLGLRAPADIRGLDAAVVRRASDIVDSIDPANAYETPSNLAALAGLLMEMWESAQTSSNTHQDILAVLETAVRQAVDGGSVTESHLAFFREALCDLGQPRLVRSHAEVIRSRFVSEGFAALPFLEDTEYHSDDEG